MTITTSPAIPVSFDALAPLRFPSDLRLTPEQFEQVCAENSEAVLELSAGGQLIKMTPTGGEAGSRNAELLLQLKLFARSHSGWKVFDSSTGFRLPDGSVLSPDGALVGLQRWEALNAHERRSFPPLCPDLVVELASLSDEGPRGVSALRRKMALYQSNGARVGWLLMPAEQAVEVWPAHGDPQRIEQTCMLEAALEFPGLRLELADIWAG